MITFDPHERYFIDYGCHRGIKFEFDNENDQKSFFFKFPNQFAPFKTFDKLNLDFKSDFEGSLFRFPIRNKEAADCSKLSSEHLSIDKLIYQEVLDSFFKDLRLILVFLKNLEQIEVYEIENGSHEFRLLASTSIDFEQSSQDLKEKRSVYKKLLEQTVLPKNKKMSPNAFQIDDIEVNFKMAIRTKFHNVETPEQMDEFVDEYLMTNYVRLKSASQVFFIFYFIFYILHILFQK